MPVSRFPISFCTVSKDLFEIDRWLGFVAGRSGTTAHASILTRGVMQYVTQEDISSLVASFSCSLSQAISSLS
ncbi:MAG: hypothetical protein WD490_07420, partial [Opitutales bacterium]